MSPANTTAAPILVAQILEVIKSLKALGVTVRLVEQNAIGPPAHSSRTQGFARTISGSERVPSLGRERMTHGMAKMPPVALKQFYIPGPNMP